MEINSRIREIIDARTSNPYAFSDDNIRDSIAKYSECSDFDVDDLDLSKGLERLYEYANINELSVDKSCILTNSVNGRIARELLDNIHIYCFDNDYYCSMASQIVNSKKNKEDKIEFIFADISQFFTSKYNGNFKADFVITCPSENSNVFKKLDCEMSYRQMNSIEYYTKRSLEFVNVGGIVCSIIPTNKESFIKSQISNYDIPVRVLGSINFTKGYTFLYIKKI